MPRPRTGKAFIPKDACWYLADVVLEHTVKGDPRNVVHVNIHLIEAHSPEQAFEKANALGRAAEQVYTNSDGKEVRVVFRGLRDLNVIHDDLQDGAELTYEQYESMPEGKLAAWVSPKDSLAVFRERQSGFAAGKPNLMPESMMEKLQDAGLDRDAIEGGA